MSSPAILRDYHFICKILKLVPERCVVQTYFEFALRRVALLAARLKLSLHGTEEMVHPALAHLDWALITSPCGHFIQKLRG